MPQQLPLSWVDALIQRSFAIKDRMLRRTVAIAIILAGASWVAFVLYVQHLNQQRAAMRPPTITVNDVVPLKDNVLPFFLSGDGLNAPLPESLEGPEIRYVSQNALNGDGSQGYPWNDLQNALCQLQPGQTLMVLDGAYPPVVIGEACAAGTPSAPIRVFLSRMTTLGPADGADTVLFEIRQPHWSIYGLEALLLEQQTAVAVAPGTHHIHLESLKIRGGVGQGVRVGFGARNISIHRSHIHHIGINAQGTAPSLDGDGVSAAIVLEPGTRDISITESKFHHIGHAPIRAIRADEMVGMVGLDDPNYFIDEISQSPSEEDAWWSKPNP